MAKTITALKVEPGKHPYAVRLCIDSKYLKYAVSEGARYICEADLIEIENDVGVIFNAEGGFLGLQGNRRVGDFIIAGVFYVIGLNETGKLVSLSHSAMDKYWTDFYEPEQYSQYEVENSYGENLFAFMDNL